MLYLLLEWCGVLTGNDDLSFLFVVTCGRSGSTLVQGVLNSIPGFSICGENNNACLDLWGFYKKWYGAVNNYKNNIMPVDSRNSWFQTCDVSCLKTGMRVLLRNLCSGDLCDRVVGFKEIRWRGMDGLEEFLVWLDSVFSPCRFLFLTRDHAEICNSKWFN